MDTSTASHNRENARYSAAAPALRRVGAGMVITIVLEYGLGIAYNLYGAMPGPGRSVGLFTSGPVLIIHALLGILMVGGSLHVLMTALGSRRRNTILLAGAGGLTLAVAVGSGFVFLDHGSDTASLAMALATGLAILCYLLIALSGATVRAA